MFAPSDSAWLAGTLPQLAYLGGASVSEEEVALHFVPEYVDFDMLLEKSGAADAVLQTLSGACSIAVSSDESGDVLLRDPTGNVVEVDREDGLVDQDGKVAVYKINERFHTFDGCGRFG